MLGHRQNAPDPAGGEKRRGPDGQGITAAALVQKTHRHQRVEKDDEPTELAPYPAGRLSGRQRPLGQHFKEIQIGSGSIHGSRLIASTQLPQRLRRPSSIRLFFPQRYRLMPLTFRHNTAPDGGFPERLCFVVLRLDPSYFGSAEVE